MSVVGRTVRQPDVATRRWGEIPFEEFSRRVDAGHDAEISRIHEALDAQIASEQPQAERELVECGDGRWRYLDDPAIALAAAAPTQLDLELAA